MIHAMGMGIPEKESGDCGIDVPII